MREIIAPDYYGEFRCRASGCPDSCCKAGWEIPVDADSFDFYKGFGVGISENTALGSDGERIFSSRGGKCAYFTSDGLCGLMIKTGRQCEICAKYPRFFEEYDGFTEAGLALSCPTACELALNYDGDPYSRLPREETSDRLLEFLIKARKSALERVYSSPDPDLSCLELCGFACGLQELIDHDELGRLEEAEFSPVSLFTRSDLEALRSFISSGTERLKPENGRYFAEKLPENPVMAGSAKMRRNYLAYLIYRRFLKAVNTEDVFSETAFIAAMYLLAGTLGEDYALGVRILSREIGHSAENVSRIIRYLSE